MESLKWSRDWNPIANYLFYVGHGEGDVDGDVVGHRFASPAIAELVDGLTGAVVLLPVGLVVYSGERAV